MFFGITLMLYLLLQQLLVLNIYRYMRIYLFKQLKLVCLHASMILAGKWMPALTEGLAE